MCMKIYWHSHIPSSIRLDGFCDRFTHTLTRTRPSQWISTRIAHNSRKWTRFFTCSSRLISVHSLLSWRCLSNERVANTFDNQINSMRNWFRWCKDLRIKHSFRHFPVDVDIDVIIVACGCFYFFHLCHLFCHRIIGHGLSLPQYDFKLNHFHYHYY